MILVACSVWMDFKENTKTYSIIYSLVFLPPLFFVINPHLWDCNLDLWNKNCCLNGLFISHMLEHFFWYITKLIYYSLIKIWCSNILLGSWSRLSTCGLTTSWVGWLELVIPSFQNQNIFLGILPGSWSRLLAHELIKT